jgi:hypothetical protein
MSDENNESGWSISIGFYPGILIGARSYYADGLTSHVLYVPFFDIAIQIVK